MTERDEAMRPRTLPTMVPSDHEEPIVLDEIIDAALSNADHQMLRNSGRTVLDVLAGTVPELDPLEIVIGVWDEHLPDDEYARAMAQLPDRLEDYQTRDEWRVRGTRPSPIFRPRSSTWPERSKSCLRDRSKLRRWNFRRAVPSSRADRDSGRPKHLLG